MKTNKEPNEQPAAITDEATWTAQERKELQHCMISVRDWMAGGCYTNDIPRPHIAALVAFAAYNLTVEAQPAADGCDCKSLEWCKAHFCCAAKSIKPPQLLGAQPAADDKAGVEAVAWADKCRIELVTAIDSLSSDYENGLYSFAGDSEALRQASGAIAHARMVAARWNWNGADTILQPLPAAPKPEKDE